MKWPRVASRAWKVLPASCKEPREEQTTCLSRTGWCRVLWAHNHLSPEASGRRAEKGKSQVELPETHGCKNPTQSSQVDPAISRRTHDDGVWAHPRNISWCHVRNAINMITSRSSRSTQKSHFIKSNTHSQDGKKLLANEEQRASSPPTANTPLNSGP